MVFFHRILTICVLPSNSLFIMAILRLLLIENSSCNKQNSRKFTRSLSKVFLNFLFPLRGSAPTYFGIRGGRRLGVPATLLISTGDCQKLSFSTLTILDFLIRQIPLTHKLCPASLLNKTEQASQAELERRVALSYLKIFLHF